MSPRFKVSNVTDRKVNESQEMTGVDDDNDDEESDSSHSVVNPFDDEEFSEVDGDSDESNDDIEEDLEREEHGKSLKREIDKVTSGENEYESHKKKQKTTLSKTPPNTEEMIRLRETENLFHSNLFRMQIEEVLLEVKPKKKDKKLVKIWVEKFMKYLLEIPESSTVYTLDDHTWLKDLKVNYPLPVLPVDPKAKFQFIKPTQVKCIGSYNSDCYVGPNYSVDIAVYMPQRFFNKEDYLNCRYHKKRALYLCHIAEYILNSTALDLSTPPQFCLQSGNQLKPVLLLKPSAKWSSRVKIYIHALPEMGSFKLSRFNPLQNNVRQKWWFCETVENNETVPTPFYNSSIGHDVVAETNDLLSIKLFEEYPNIKDALILLKVWLHQRELDEGPAGFSGFLLSMLLVYLFRRHKLNPLMSSYQILRNTWLNLCQTDWSTNGLSLAENNSGISIEEFNANYEVVFVDSTGFVNLASNITKLNYLWLKEEAVFAMKYLDNSNLNSFQALFMVHKPFLRQFDHVISINMKKTFHKWKSTVEDDKTKIGLLLDKMQLFVSVVGDLLTKGLGERICKIVIKNSAFHTWSVFTNVPKVLCESVFVGLRLNPETALSVIEKGPEANTREGAQFRQFWGSKSELRRFQDGSTCESVVWDTPDAPFARRRLIAQNIVEYLFENVMKLRKNSYKYISNQLESLLKVNSLPDEVGGIEELSLNVIKSLDGLMKQVRDLSLPLPVTSVLGASPVLRFTDVFPPVAYEGYSKCLDNKGLFILKDTLKKSLASAQQIDVTVQLGISKKWPENIEAIRRIRAALIIEIAKALSEQSSLRTQPFPDYLIVFKDGYVFRLKVVYPREIALIKEVINSEGLTAYRDTPQSLKMEKKLLHLPKLTGTLHGLSQQYLGYGSTVCLTKRWLRSQMIDDELFPDVVIELLVVSQFLSPEPFTAVLQPQMAFLRVLNMLAHTNWCLEPVIVNFNDDLQRDDLTEIEQTFRTGRDNGSLPGLFIATSYDKTGVIWTKDAPSLPILFHIAKLAKESLTILESQLLRLDNDLSELKTVFRPPLDFYDTVIHLNVKKNTRYLQGIDFEGSKRNMVKSCNSKHYIPVSEFNPVQCYLKELRENYGEFALFFHDTYGGDVIGVIFKPTVNQTYDFKVSHINGRKPVLVGKDYKLTFNKEAVIEDFKHIGKYVVRNITVNQKT